MTYLVAAYSAFWIILFLYIYSLRVRQSSMEKTVESLQKRVEQVQ